MPGRRGQSKAAACECYSYRRSGAQRSTTADDINVHKKVCTSICLYLRLFQVISKSANKSSIAVNVAVASKASLVDSRGLRRFSKYIWRTNRIHLLYALRNRTKKLQEGSNIGNWLLLLLLMMLLILLLLMLRPLGALWLEAIGGFIIGGPWRPCSWRNLEAL